MMTVGALPGYASASSSTTSVRFPIQIAIVVPCANGGAGDIVVLSGTLHDVFHITVDSRGGLHLTTHDNPQGVRGVGLASGTRYRGTGVTRSGINVGRVGSPFTLTFVNNFRIIGQGPGNNFLVHDNFHVTVNANGAVTALVDNFTIDCK